MSRKNNLNPDHYKTAGRGRQGDAVNQASHRQKFTEEEARRAHGGEDSVGRTSAEHEKKERSKSPPAPGGQGKRDAAPQQRDQSPRRGAGSGRRAGRDVEADRGPRDEEPGDVSAEGEP